MQSAYLFLSRFGRCSHTKFVARAAASTSLRNVGVFSNEGWFRITCVLGVPIFVVWVHPYIKKVYVKEHNEDVKLSWHERQYNNYCTVNYDGDKYMSPRDFLESVSQQEPRAASYQVIDNKMLQNFARKTPSLSKGSTHFLRDIWNDGILSYGDYLFLLTALTKPRRQFEIVFKMIDVDGNDSVDIEEFELMLKTITRQKESSKNKKDRAFRTTLALHLFGQGSHTKLSSHDLFRFIDNIQNEVREMEFNKFSLGGPTITPDQFAKIILRHTNFDMQRVQSNLQAKFTPSAEHDITFEQFSNFCHLLNALDDFACAMTMYTIAGLSITEEEFARATKLCTGKELSSHVVHIIFNIFDLDGDGKLSHKEFLSVMKDWKLGGRKIRQAKTYDGLWLQFKTCIKSEMKNQ